ncbi:CPBP family glutamic-type intramembrane protease, partial [Hymenobacter terricola]|uniref:CPBP family glutamic-type intramembrane protease n=1 Tax=Hymenobacter terricola TaxID=2819236 RepID=UPI001CF49E36
MEVVEFNLPVSNAAPPALPYPTIKESWGILGWYMLMTLLVGMPIYLLFNKALHLSKTASLLALAPIVNVALLGFLRWKAGTRWATVQFTGHEQAWVYAVLPVMIVTLGIVLSLQQMLHLPNWMGKTFEKATEMPVFATAVIVILAPVFEELLFRGVILQGLLRSQRPWVA